MASLTATGLATGIAATQVLDWISIALYEGEDRKTRHQEDRARNHKHVYEVAVDRFFRNGGVKLSKQERKAWGWGVHKAFGYSAGLAYTALRNRYPGIGWANGLGFGIAFFLIADELVMPLLGWAPGPQKFSWKVHARGALSHIAYGVAAETVYRLLHAPKRQPA